MGKEKTFEVTAVWDDNHYRHFGIHPKTASMYGDNVDDIITLNLKISDDQSIPAPNSEHEDADYWGWLATDSDVLSMIYAQRFLVDMCFPAGIKGTEETGQGKAYRLEIIL